jgi:hypothetical protein
MPRAIPPHTLFQRKGTADQDQRHSYQAGSPDIPPWQNINIHRCQRFVDRVRSDFPQRPCSQLDSIGAPGLHVRLIQPGVACNRAGLGRDRGPTEPLPQQALPGGPPWVRDRRILLVDSSRQLPKFLGVTLSWPSTPVARPRAPLVPPCDLHAGITESAK